MRKHGLPVLVAGAILLGCASQDRSQGGGAAGTTLSAQPGFLTKIGRIPEIERHCATAVTQAGPVNCPWTLSAGGRPSGAGGQTTSTILANLPHLRMDVVLRRMENKIVSGGGVKTPFIDLVVVFWTLSSNAATSIIDYTYPVNSPVPGPGESWDITHNDHLFAGIIAKGCSNTAEFDIALQSSIGEADGDATFGDVSLSDETVGSGYYVFRYKIRATGLDGGVSDFFFSGEVPVTCVAEATI